jgi:hypothetical protein
MDQGMGYFGIMDAFEFEKPGPLFPFQDIIIMADDAHDPTSHLAFHPGGKKDHIAVGQRFIFFRLEEVAFVNKQRGQPEWVPLIMFVRKTDKLPEFFAGIDLMDH